MRRAPGIRTRYLIAAIAAADALLFGGAVPFELYCRSAAQRGAAPSALAAMLVGNLLLFALTLCAGAISIELMRRGFRFSLGALTRRVRPRVPALVRVRSRRSGY